MKILFINPSEIATRIIPAFKVKNSEVAVLLTNGRTLESGTVPADLSNVRIIDLAKEEWDRSLKIMSAVAWDQEGHKFLESINDQIALCNVNIPGYIDKRKSSYLNLPVEEDTIFIDTLSYKGRHVVMSVWKYIGGQWKLFQEFKVPEFINAIEHAWANLDAQGVINGPSQSYVMPGNIIKLKFHPTNAAYGASKGLVTRHWFEIWPVVIEHEINNPKKSINSFYDWVERSGSSKRFETQPT